MNKSVRRLVIYALMCALTSIGTWLVKIPTPGTEGYVNFGDSVIFITGVIFGPVAGLVAGGIGSAMTDLLGGWAHWAPWTLVIKGIEGLLVGLIAHGSFKKTGHFGWQTAVGLAVPALWMMTAYCGANCVMYGNEAGLLSIPGNLIQGSVSIVFAVPMLFALRSVMKHAKMNID